MDEEQHLPYWKLVNKKGKVVIVPQTGSISSPVHHLRGIYFYDMNYYEILKECLHVLHELQPKDFQIALDKLSVMRFPLVEIEIFSL